MKIAIVGGGPAGSSASIVLARAGHVVTLFERFPVPRERVCGEFVSAEALDSLALLGVDPSGWPIRTARIHGPGGRVLEAPLPRAGCFGLERTVLDLRLRDAAAAAGVEVRGVEVRRLEAGRVDGEFFGAVVDATGRWALSHGAPPRPAGYGYRAAFDGGVPEDRVELHLFPGGYAGLSGVAPGRANVCMLAPLDLARRHGGDLDAAFAAVLDRAPALRAGLAGAARATPWAAIGFPPARFSGCHHAGIWRVGDAAGTVAPLGGEGISMALRGGVLLATHLVAGPRAYEAAWRAEFGRRMRWCGLLSALAVRPRAAAAGVAFLSLFPGLFRTLVAVTRS